MKGRMPTAADCIRAAVHFSGPPRLPYEVHLDLRRFREALPREEVREIEELAAGAEPFLLHLWDGSTDYFDHREYRDAWGIHWIDGCPAGPRYASPRDEVLFPPVRGAPWHEEGLRLLGGAGAREAYALGHVWFTLFERLHLLFGFEAALTLPLLERRRFLELRDRIVEHNLAKIELFLSLGVDGLFFSDDWGSQQGLIIDRRDWQALYAPAYERMFAPIHEAGREIWFHSCGNIMPLIPDLIRLGVAVLNPVQTSVLDVGELSRRFGGRLCFFGGLDVQHFLPAATPEEIRREVVSLRRQLGCFHGGYIGGTSHTILPDVPLRNIRAVFQAFRDPAPSSGL